MKNTKTLVKRFRIFDIENQSCPAKFDELSECYEWLKSKPNLEDYFVDCVVDDIEVDATRIVETFNEGEIPSDLTFF